MFKLIEYVWAQLFKCMIWDIKIKILHLQVPVIKAICVQNIDTLEHVAGISAEKLVEAHGSFRAAHCLLCSKEYSQDWVKGGCRLGCVNPMRVVQNSYHCNIMLLLAATGQGFCNLCNRR